MGLSETPPQGVGVPMATPYEFLTAAVYVPRRNDLLTNDVEQAFASIEAAGFALDTGGQLRVATARQIPELTGETPSARTFDGAVSLYQAISMLRHVSADYWGQIMLRGRFAIGGHFENATVVVCPFSLGSPALFSAHILFRKPGLLVKDRSPSDRAAHAVEALDRLQDAFAPVAIFLDSEQPPIDVQRLKAGRLPWLPWAGYLSPGAVKSIGGGALQVLPDWLKWLEEALHAKGASASRRTKGGGFIWVLPERNLGKEASAPGARAGLEPWKGYLRRVVA